MSKMNAKKISEAIEEIFPLGLAQDWDNVGLLIGDSQKSVKNVLLTIDTTNDVVAEAKRLGTDLIVSYHPVIWDGLKRITAEGPSSNVYELIRSGIAVFSVHTALDAAVGGVNDGLAEIVGIKDGKPIGDYVANPSGDNYKLVVFVPTESLADVSNAVPFLPPAPALSATTATAASAPTGRGHSCRCKARSRLSERRAGSRRCRR